MKRLYSAVFPPCSKWWLVLMLCANGAAFGADPAKVPSVADIAAAMAAARMQYTDVSLRFDSIDHDYDPVTRKPDGTFTYHVLYKRKLGGAAPMESFDFSTQATDPHGQPRANALSYSPTLTSGIVAFDGTATLVLNRVPDKHGRLRADIYPSRLRASFPQVYTPLDLAWNWYLLPWDEVITAGDFQVAPDPEVFHGLTVYKVMGAGKQIVGDVTLWVAPDRNFLPLRVEMVYPKDDKYSELSERVERRTLHDLVKLENGVWMPKRIVSEAVHTTITAECRVLEASAKPLDVNAFHPDLPPKTLVSDRVSGISFEVPQAPTTQGATMEPVTEMEKAIKDYADEAERSLPATALPSK